MAAGQRPSPFTCKLPGRSWRCVSGFFPQTLSAELLFNLSAVSLGEASVVSVRYFGAGRSGEPAGHWNDLVGNAVVALRTTAEPAAPRYIS